MKADHLKIKHSQKRNLTGVKLRRYRATLQKYRAMEEILKTLSSNIGKWEGSGKKHLLQGLTAKIKTHEARIPRQVTAEQKALLKDFREAFSNFSIAICMGLWSWGRSLGEKKANLPRWLPNDKLCVVRAPRRIKTPDGFKEYVIEDNDPVDIDCKYPRRVYKWLPSACDEILTLLRAIEPTDDDIDLIIEDWLSKKASLHIIQGLYLCFLVEWLIEVGRKLQWALEKNYSFPDNAIQWLKERLKYWENQYKKGSVQRPWQSGITRGEYGLIKRGLERELSELRYAFPFKYKKRPAGKPASDSLNLFLYLTNIHLKNSHILNPSESLVELLKILGLRFSQNDRNEKDTISDQGFNKLLNAGEKEYTKRKDAKSPELIPGFGYTDIILPEGYESWPLGHWKYWAKQAFKPRRRGEPNPQKKDKIIR